MKYKQFEISFKPVIAILLLICTCSCTTLKKATVYRKSDGPEILKLLPESPQTSEVSEFLPESTGPDEGLAVRPNTPEPSDPPKDKPEYSQVSETSERLFEFSLYGHQSSEIPETSEVVRYEFSETPEAVTDTPNSDEDLGVKEYPEYIFHEADAEIKNFDETEYPSEYPPDAVTDMQFYSEYSKKLGIPLDGSENKVLIMKVSEWLGVPYKWGGYSKKGIDCSALVQLIYREVYGIKISRTAHTIFKNDIIPIGRRELQEGDVICFKMKGKRISHIGLYLKDNKFVHAINRGVIISDITRRYYRKRFASGGRIPGREDESASASESDRMKIKTADRDTYLTTD